MVTASASAVTKTISFTEMTPPVFTVSLWDALWGGVSLLLREKLILRAEEAGQARNAPCPVAECHNCAAAAALSARGVKSFAYEWECFLVTEVERATTHPARTAEQLLPFTPGTVWQEETPRLSHCHVFMELIFLLARWQWHHFLTHAAVAHSNGHVDKLENCRWWLLSLGQMPWQGHNSKLHSSKSQSVVHYQT